MKNPLIARYETYAQRLMNVGFEVSDDKSIQYGYQFRITSKNDAYSKVVRLYKRNDGSITTDLSQLGDCEIAKLAKHAIWGIVGENKGQE